MIERKLTVKLKNGLHARPSCYIIKKLQPLNLKVATLTYGKETADLKSILSLLTLGVMPETVVTIKLSGEDELLALSIIEDVFSEKDNNVIY